MTTPIAAEDVLAGLRRIVGARNVLTDPSDMAPHLEDWRGYSKGTALAVVLPGSTGEVASLARLAAEHGRSLVPQGGNTSLCQGSVPPEGGNGIVVALRRMASIREIDKPSGVMVVDAGATLSSVHAAAADVERRVPINLGSEGTAQIGGLLSTNAGGTSALRFGPMRELVCGIEVVLPDGRVFSDLRALRKDNTGYDLRNLFVGAEGTLGIVTAAALRMHPMLRASGHAWIGLADLEAAVTVLTGLQDRFDTAVQAAELLSASQVDLVLKHIPRTRHPLETRPEWSLLVELGSSDAGADLQGPLEEWLAERFEDGTVTDAFVAQSEAQGGDIWHVRHSVSEANKIHGHSLSHDVAVRPSLVPRMIEACREGVQAVYPGANILIVSHIGDGNVHFIVHFTHAEWETFRDPKAVTDEVMRIVHDQVEALGGTFSAEHGIGRKLKDELARRADPVRLELMRAIRGVIDPDRRMNPGTIL
ncbi:FAD-binding oxidoreductase [Aureimonas sp. AU40]|uniref:FAD-binding oxidoreductase n=1 Tax=Aureimonas sp. AU40 TaxID=1637747 RepID=UPI00078092F3|nr:FAD-binding oxidoreductase [Aureimonas sp. AU40]